MPRRQKPRRQKGGFHKQGAPKDQTPKKLIPGIVQVTRKGTGYLPWPEGQKTASDGKEKEDIEIFPEKLNGALNGDQAEVELLTLLPRPRGRVKKIVERAKTQFVGVVRGNSVKPDDARFPTTISVAGTHAEGDKVLVELLSFDGQEAK